MTGFVKQKFIKYQTSYEDTNEELFSHSITPAGEGGSQLQSHHLGVKRRNQRPAGYIVRSRSAAEWNQVKVGEGRIIHTLVLKSIDTTTENQQLNSASITQSKDIFSGFTGTATKENCSLPSGHRDLSQPRQENCRSQSHKRNNRSLQAVHFSHQNIGCFRSCGNFPHEIHVNLLIN